MSKGSLIVLSGPSGSGKGTILSKLLTEDKNTFLSVSATTRLPRPGEVDGANYHFMTKEQFESLIQSGGMLEYACYCDNYYGTPKKAVYDQIEKGNNVILEIEVQGAMQIKNACPEAILVFVLPPSIQVLENRLRGRGTEDEDTVLKRMETAKKEIKMATEYDFVIINDDLDEAVDDLANVIKASKSYKNSMKQFLHNHYKQ
ncbi:MAG: guanylate kinase [Oscillospiraceae bacterium]|nr:guanylate kinase [Oscillospiraceae bacterium]